MQVFRAHAFDADDNSFYVPMSQSDWMRARTCMMWNLCGPFTISTAMSAEFYYRRMPTSLSLDASDWCVAKCYKRTAASDEISQGRQQVDGQVR